MSGVTLGHFLIGFAILDVIAVLWMKRGFERSNPDATAEQRRGMRLLVAAAFALGVVTVLIALFVPSIGQIPLF